MTLTIEKLNNKKPTPDLQRNCGKGVQAYPIEVHPTKKGAEQCPNSPFSNFQRVNNPQQSLLLAIYGNAVPNDQWD